MFKVTSYPIRTDSQPTYTKHHPDVEHDILMDLDENDENDVFDRISSPGEILTSSHAFMRYVFPDAYYSDELKWHPTNV